jgi:hypothetical protein
VSSKAVRIQKLESLIAMCREYLDEERPDNGGKTLLTEIMALLKGKLASIKKEKV